MEEQIKITNKLLNEINNFLQAIETYKEIEERIKKERYEDKPYESIEKRLKKQEGYYDRLYELYERNKQIIEHEKRVEAMFGEYLAFVTPFVSESKHKTETIGNQLNELLEEMKEKEKEIKGD